MEVQKQTYRESMEVENKMMKNFKRSTKGLSPIFATLILIAIAVIAGIVVYMFSSGYIGQLTGSGPAVTEKAAVQGVDVTSNEVFPVQTVSSSSWYVPINSSPSSKPAISLTKSAPREA